MTEPFYKRQPILAGCLGCLGVGVLGTIAVVVFMGLLGKSCIDSASRGLGLDSLPATIQDAMKAGYGIQINSNHDNGVTESEIVMPPMEPRKVTCDDLQAVLFPHLTGTLETVVVRSESYEPGPDGSLQPVPLTCTWSGFPPGGPPAGDSK